MAHTYTPMHTSKTDITFRGCPNLAGLEIGDEGSWDSGLASATVQLSAPENGL